VDCLHSDAFVRAVSTGAVALYRHLMWPAKHLPLRSAFGLCWNALGLSTQLFARRLRSYPREISSAHCRELSQAHGSRITFEVWTRRGTWFWHVVNPQGTGGTIGAAATEVEAIREARSSIAEMSARVAASQFIGDAAPIEDSNLNPTASSSTSSWVGAGRCGESIANCRSSTAKREP
jgi:hypothetical protein